MVSAKDMIIKVIPSATANDFIKKCHYSGKVVNNSQVHFGAFLNGHLHGAISLGPSLDKSKVIGLVKDTKWNEFIELNRLAFDDSLPKNSESRAIAIVMKLLKKNAPHLKWVISFADATQCGDGAIYRASGFHLVGIKENNRLLRMPDGTITHGINLTRQGSCNVSKKYNPRQLSEHQIVKELGAEYLPGYQIKYIYFLDKSKQADLTVPILPFKMIDDLGAGMYRGKPKEKSALVVHPVRTPGDQPGEGGSIPTPTHMHENQDTFPDREMRLIADNSGA